MKTVKRKGIRHLTLPEVFVYSPEPNITKKSQVVFKKGDAVKLWGRAYKVKVPKGGITFVGRKNGISLYSFRPSFWRWLLT